MSKKPPGHNVAYASPLNQRALKSRKYGTVSHACLEWKEPSVWR